MDEELCIFLERCVTKAIEYYGIQKVYKSGKSVLIMPERPLSHP